MITMLPRSFLACGYSALDPSTCLVIRVRNLGFRVCTNWKGRVLLCRVGDRIICDTAVPWGVHLVPKVV